LAYFSSIGWKTFENKKELTYIRNECLEEKKKKKKKKNIFEISNGRGIWKVSSSFNLKSSF